VRSTPERTAPSIDSVSLRALAGMRSTALLAVLALTIVFAGAQEPAPVEPAGDVHVGERVVLSLRVDEGSLTPPERADIADAHLRDALQDPQCGPEFWKIIRDDENRILTICGKRVITVTPADAEREGTVVADLAARWSAVLEKAYAEEQQVVFSSRLLHRALTGLLLTLGYLGAVILVWFTASQIELRLFGKIEKSGGVKAGPVKLLSSSVERRVLMQFIFVLKIVASLVLTYLFLIAVFQQFPASARLAERMLLPLPGLMGEMAEGLLGLLPRISLGFLILLVTRVILGAIGRLFTRVREHKIRLEPLLSEDTAGPAELTARALVIGTAILLIALLVPGRVSSIFLAVFGLVGFALALGARELTADLLWGLVTIYGRPFRRGQRVKTQGFEGVVKHKGLTSLRLEMDDGRMIILPNHLALESPMEVILKSRKLLLLVTLESVGGGDACVSILRHAAAEAGLKREEGVITLIAIRENHMDFQVEWPVPAGDSRKETRDRFLKTIHARIQNSGETKLIAAAPRDGTHV
jgi:hypothetical protein